MNKQNEKLNMKEVAGVAVQSVLQLIPVVGGPLSSAYFGYKQEKRFKRMESFYKELLQDVQKLQTTGALATETYDEDELIAIIECLNAKVEREHLEEKRRYFKTYFLHLLTKPQHCTYDDKLFFLDIIASMTQIECKALSYLYQKFDEIPADDVICGATDKHQQRGVIRRLESYGFVDIREDLEIYMGGDHKSKKFITITSYGIKFVQFCLMTD